MPDWLRWAGSEFFDAEVVGRLLLASLLGAIIGFERERSQKAAGLRTNILICLGSALVMEVSRFLAEGWGRTVDPTRMAAQVISGVGFIGAGTILVARGRVVVGLTTAATIWAVAAIGIAVGAAAYTHAVVTTCLIVFVLSFLAKVEDYIFAQSGAEILELDLAPNPASLDRVRELLARDGLRAQLSEIEKRPDGIHAVLEISPGSDEVIRSLAGDPDVRRINLVAKTPK